MNRSIKPIFNIANLNTKLFLNCLKEVDDKSAYKRFNKITNNLIFIAIHLLDARYYICNYIGAKVKNPLEDELKDVRKIEDMKQLPGLKDIIDLWEKVSNNLESAISKVTNSELAKKSKFKFPVDDNSKLGGISFLIQHESYHIGQLGFLRKSLGFKPMKYP